MPFVQGGVLRDQRWSVPGFMDTGLSRDLTDVSIS
jgi:hypothetical protein